MTVALAAALVFFGVTADVAAPALAAPAGSVIGTAHAIKCIDMPSYTNEVGAYAVQWDCHGGANQRFKFYPQHSSGSPGLYFIQNINSGLCLQAPGPETGARAGERVVQFFCGNDGPRNHRWSVRYGGKNSEGWHSYQFHMPGIDGGQICMDVDHTNT